MAKVCFNIRLVEKDPLGQHTEVTQGKIIKRGRTRLSKLRAMGCYYKAMPYDVPMDEA